MKTARNGIMLVLFLLLSLPATAQDGERTLVNNERAPFFFVLLPPDQVIIPQSETSIVQALRHARDHLRIVAPEGMVPIPAESGTLVGYYGSAPSSLAYRTIVKPLTDDSTPVRIGRSELVRVGGTTLQLSPWELPSYPDPVITDGRDDDWENIAPIHSFSATDNPRRVEITTLGEIVGLDRARFWRMGGTSVRHVYGLVSDRNWFVALRTEGPILNNTGYHFRVVSELGDRPVLFEFSILVDGRSGPVVYTLGDQPLQWAGQYALHEGFLEVEVSGKSITKIAERVGDSRLQEVSIELASSHRTPARAERFTLGSFPLTETAIHR